MVLSLKLNKKSKSTIDVKKKKEDKLKVKKERQILKEQGNAVKKLIEDWKDIMYQTGTYNNFYETFTFDKIKYEKFGFSVNLYCPKGLTFKALDTIRDKIEDSLHCIFIFNKERLDRYMEVRIVTQISTDKEYAPPKTKPWEIYIGDRFDGSPIIIDLNKWCQVLLSGTTGGGKSKLLDCVLATQVYNHTPKDLWLFLIQLDKCDLLLYEDADICKGFADNLDKSVVMLEFIMKELDKRNKLVAIVKKKGKGSNITDYNELFPNNQQPTIWVVLDEMASIAEKGSDSKEVKEKKQMIDDMLSAIAQFGRSNNVFLISCLQRPTAQLLNTFIKSMSNLKISFRQSNQKSSEVAMDDSSIALDLAQRVAVYKLLSYDFLQTPFISDPIIMKHIKHKLKPNHHTIFNNAECNRRMQELKDIGKKDEKPKESNDSTQKPESTGKQDISYEMFLLQKEQEMKQREEEINNKLKLLESKQNDVVKQREIMKDDHSKLETSINSLLQEAKNKNPNWVEYQPIKSGKEKIK